MSESTRPTKSVIDSAFDRMGDLIITAIRFWKILRSPRARRIIFHRQKKEQRSAALLKKREDWAARRRRRRKKTKSLHLPGIVRLQRQRFTRFHRQTSPVKLLALYLGSAAVLSLILTAIAIFSQPPTHTRPLTVAASAREEPLDKLLAETLRLLADNRLDEAQQNLDVLNIRAPGNFVVLAHNGAMHMLRKNYPAARTAYLKALEVKPDSYITRYNLAEVEFLIKNYPEAERLFRQMHEANPQDEIILFRLALCAILQNNDENYRRYLGKLSSAGRSPAWQYATAARLIQDKKPGEAAKLIRQARAIYGEQTQSYDTTFREMGLAK